MERVGPSFSWVMDGRQVGVVGFNLDSRIASRGLILSDLSQVVSRGFHIISPFITRGTSADSADFRVEDDGVKVVYVLSLHASCNLLKYNANKIIPRHTYALGKEEYFIDSFSTRVI